MNDLIPDLPAIDSPGVAHAAVRAALALGERWQLSPDELARLLGIDSPGTLEDWRRRVPDSLPPDTLERASYLLHIFRSLAQLFGAERTAEWLRSPNDGAPFLGITPLEHMRRGRVQHLIETHRYLQRFATGAF